MLRCLVAMQIGAITLKMAGAMNMEWVMVLAPALTFAGAMLVITLVFLALSMLPDTSEGGRK